jgi:hypothetical protein
VNIFRRCPYCRNLFFPSIYHLTINRHASLPMLQAEAGSRPGVHSRPSSVRMSRSRLFLSGSVSTVARLRFIGGVQSALQWSCRSSNMQRTANSVLFSCLSPGGHPTKTESSVLPLTESSVTPMGKNENSDALFGGKNGNPSPTDCQKRSAFVEYRNRCVNIVLVE